MIAVDAHELAARVMLTEYEQLKSEQRSRIGFRDNLIYAVLIASAAVASATAARGAVFLLGLPPVAALLGWAYLANDVKVSQLKRYLSAELGPAVAALIPGADGSAFGWEQPRTDPDRARRKRLQLAADLLAFCVLPASALAVFWLTGPASVLLVLVSVAELAGLGLLASEIIGAAEVDPINWRRRLRFGRVALYLEPRDIWLGAYVGKHAVYVCPLPCVVVRWSR